MLRPLVEISEKFTVVSARKQKLTFRVFLLVWGRYTAVSVATILGVTCAITSTSTRRKESNCDH